MYLRGMGDVYDDYGGLEPQEVPGEIYAPSVAVPAPAGIPQASTQWPTISGDWAGVFKTALQTYGSTNANKAQIEAARLRTANPYGYYNPLSPSPGYLAPGYSPFPVGGGGTLLGISLTTWLLLAAGGAAIYIATQK